MVRTDLLPAFPAINGAIGIRTKHINGMFIIRVGEYLYIVPGPLQEAVVPAHPAPVCTGIGRGKQASLFLIGVALHQRIYPLRVGP